MLGSHFPTTRTSVSLIHLPSLALSLDVNLKLLLISLVRQRYTLLVGHVAFSNNPSLCKEKTKLSNSIVGGSGCQGVPQKSSGEHVHDLCMISACPVPYEAA